MKQFRKTFLSLLMAFALVVQMVPMKLIVDAASNDTVKVVVENNTFTEAVDDKEPPWTGILVDTTVEMDNETNAMELFKKALIQEGIEFQEAGGYVSSINELAEFDGGQMSGWMVTINDWFTNTGIHEQTVEAYDEIRFMYTCAYGEDLGGTWSNNDKSVKALDFSVGKLSPSFSSDVNEYTLTVPKGTKGVVVTPTATNKNFQVRTSVDKTYYKRNQTVPISDGTVIDVTCGDPTWPSMNNQAGGTGSSTPGMSYKITVKEEKEVMPVKVIVENTTFTEAEDEESDPPAWSGTLFSGNVEIEEGSTVLTAIKAALDSKNIPYTTTSSGYLTAINGLSQDDALMGGWMGTVNDWFTSDNFVDCKLEANDEVRVMYTNAWGEDLGGSWSSKDKTIKALTTSAGKLIPSFKSDVKKYSLVLPEGTDSVVVTPTATNKYFQVRASVGDTEYKRSAAIPVAEGTVIKVKCGDPSWPSMLNGEYGNGAENVPAETYELTVTYKEPVEEYKLDLSVEPTNGGAVDLLTTTYDADYNSTEQSEKGLTSKSINISAFGDNNAELKFTAVAASGYKFVGWKVGDKVYTAEDGEIAALTGFASLVDANSLYLFNYTEEGKLNPSKNLAVAAVFEEKKVNVTFDDGIEATENIVKEVAIGEALDFVPAAPVKEGYTFVGWFKDVDDTTTKYQSGQAYTEDVTYTAKYAHVTMLGAQAKLVVKDKSGIRFGTKIYDDGDKIVEKGTLILPANLLAEGEVLTLDTPKVAVSVGNVLYEINANENSVVYLGSIVNIPRTQFDRQLTAAAYVKYVDKAGNEYTVYAPYQNGSTSINDLITN